MSLRFGCNLLQGTSKQGVIKPDEDGYYYLCLGALNYHNAAGQYYSYEGSLKAFQRGSRFFRAITGANLYSERDHPEKGNLSLEQYVARIRKVDPANLCAHIREIEFKSIGKAKGVGDNIMGIYGWVKPFGPHAADLKAALENPKQNVCFSVRSTIDIRTHPTMGATQIRDILECITFDWVLEPGINLAHKYGSPALEGLCDVEDDGIEVPAAILRQFVDKVESSGAYGLESADVESLREYVDRDTIRHGAVVRQSALTKW